MPPMNEIVQIDDDLELSPAMPAEALMKLADVAHQVLQRLAVVADLSIVIAPDELVHDLNKRHRGVDAPTDVLSFPAEPLPPEIAAEETPYLGDLILAYPYTLTQAQATHHNPADEFALLVVHGILHLLGYDHDTPASQQIMWQKQAELLKMLDIAIVVPDFVHHPDDAH